MKQLPNEFSVYAKNLKEAKYITKKQLEMCGDSITPTSDSYYRFSLNNIVNKTGKMSISYIKSSFNIQHEFTCDEFKKFFEKTNIEMKIGDKLEDYIFLDKKITCYSDNKGTIFSETGYNLNDFPNRTITDVTDEYFQVSVFNFGWFKKENIIKKQINMENKKIIGYKTPFDLTGGSSHIAEKGTIYVQFIKNNHLYIPENETSTHLSVPKEIAEKWEPVYEEEKKLPTINGHKGKVEGDFIIYGSNCAKFHKDFFRHLNTINEYNATGNREIESITLGTTQVKITMDQVKQIVEFLNK